MDAKDTLFAALGGILLGSMAIYLMLESNQQSSKSQIHKWFSAHSVGPYRTDTILAMPRNEVLFAVILALVEIGLSEANIRPNFVVALLIWAAIAGLTFHISWVSTPKWVNGLRLLRSVVAFCCVLALIEHSLRDQWEEEHRPPSITERSLTTLVPFNTEPNRPPLPLDFEHLGQKSDAYRLLMLLAGEQHFAKPATDEARQAFIERPAAGH